MGNALNRAMEIAAGSILVKARVADEVKQQRQSVCNSCEKRDVESNRCKVCKCFLEVKTGSLENRNVFKLRDEVTHCPLGKWDDKEIANFYRKLEGEPEL